MRSPVVLAFDAASGRYGTVYHRPTCMVLSRTFGSKTVPIEAAESMGRPACAICHRIAPTRIACPFCDRKGREVALIIGEDPRGLTVLRCPDCKRQVRQLYKPDGHTHS